MADEPLHASRAADATAYERRIVSVLFADLVGFTALSESLDPEDVVTVQDAYFSTVREVVGRYGGQLEKFIGDAAMAVFGVPIARDDDAERAVRAALALVAAVEQLGGRIGLDENPLRLRVGVNTGEVVWADTGPDRGRVTGDTVNVTARLQGAAAPGQVLVGASTALAVEESVELAEPTLLELKGKAAAVPASAVVRLRPDPSREHALGRLRAPTLGRESELAALSEMLADLAPGIARRCLILAPPGVGKSRLVNELATIAAADGVRVLRARLRLEDHSPFEPVRQLISDAVATAADGEPEGVLGQALEAADISPARAEHVVRLAATLTGDGEGGDGDRETRFSAWLDALDALVAGPVIWLLEDLHWASPDLLHFLSYAHGAPGRGRLVVATARPSLLEREADWTKHDPERGAVRLDLGPLASGAAGALVEALVGSVLPPALVERIVERSDGNPLFIEELLRTWVSVGVLVPSDDAGADRGGWRLASRADDVPLPPTVQSLYAAQLDDLPPDARRVARRAAVAGRRFAEAWLAPLDAGDPQALRTLTTRALVSGPTDDRLGPSYAYRHALLRDAGYASLARAERARLHLRLAEWLQEAARQSAVQLAPEIADHYLQALRSLPSLVGGTESAADRAALSLLTATWLDRAAAVHAESAAHATAADALRTAIELTPPTARLDLARRWARLGEVISFTDHMDDAVTALREAADRYRDLLAEGDGPVRDEARAGFAGAVAQLGTVRIEQLQFEEASALAESAMAVIGGGNDLAAGRLRLLRAWARLAYQTDPGVRDDLEAALAAAVAAGEARVQLEARFWLHALLGDLGELSREELLAGDEETARLALEVGDVRRAVISIRGRAMLQLSGGPRGVAEQLAQAEGLAETHGLREEVAWVHYAHAELGYLAGDWELASRRGTQAIEIGEQQAYDRVVVRTWMVLSEIAAQRGERDGLERAAGWFEPRREGFPKSPFGRFMHAAVDLRLAAAGLVAPFVPGPDLVDGWAEVSGLASWWAAAATVLEAWLEAGELDLARAALAAAAPWVESRQASPLDQAGLRRCQARLALAAGDHELAGAEARAAVRAFDAIGAPWEAARSLRLLEASGGATPADVARAREVEERLGVVVAAATSGTARSRGRESGRSGRR